MNQETKFLGYLKEIALLDESVYLAEWDSQTGMPQMSNQHRAELTSYLSSLSFEKQNGAEMKGFIEYFESNPDELSEYGKEVFKKVKENYDLNHRVPKSLYQEYSKEVSNAHGVWLKAREQKDFNLFAPTLERIISLTKQLIPYWKKDEETDYDVLLNLYEPGMSVAQLDRVFDDLKSGIMQIRNEIELKGTTPDASFLKRHVPKSQQQVFVKEIVKQLGYDFDKGRLDDTVHPFMMKINRNDARITTRWNEEDFLMATFGVIHEAGHGMYEQNIDAKYDYTPLSGGTSMGIHESQSLFNEIIIGGNRCFWKKQYPLLNDVTNGVFSDISEADFYKGLKRTESSLIRIEADTLTYPLHIIIRYEIEKLLFNENVDVYDLPKIWEEKYQEYLGIKPSNDLEGVLQDVHWSGGSFGYFPSYALGYIYAAQLHYAMSQELDIDQILMSEDYSDIRIWLTDKIHQYGASKKPYELMEAATGKALDSKYLLDYLKAIYFEVYTIQ